MKRKLLFTAPVLTASGYGVHSRQLLAALVASNEFDIYVDSIRWGETGFLTGEEFAPIRVLAERQKPTKFDVAVHVSIPNEFKRKAHLTIGVTAGIEVDRVSPEWLVKCNAEVDLVVVPSEHSRRSFMVEYTGPKGEKLRLEKPIFVMSEGVDTTIYHPEVEATFPDLILPKKNFVCVGLGFDKPQGRDRKNMTTLVEWFSKTFEDNPDVGLVLKVGIVNSSAVDFETVKKRITDIKHSTIGAKEFPVITLLHGRFTDHELAGLYTDPRIIAMVSLTHGEGFGLPLLEAAACALPIVATDWSGHLDFLTKEGKKLFVPIDSELKPIHPDCVWPGVIEAGSQWAFPKEEDASTKMKKMTISTDTPRKWSKELADHIKERFSLETTGQEFAKLVIQASDEMKVTNPPSKEEFVKALRLSVSKQGPSLIYTMPMSAGDVFLSTGVVRALRLKHPGHRVYFATSSQYFEIIKDLRTPEAGLEDGSLLVDEIIDWMSWMQDVGMLEDIFDEVYTPNLAVQMTHSNWVHKGKGRHLIEEFAVQCGVEAMQPLFHREPSALGQPTGTWVTVHAGGQKSARNYAWWKDVVRNLRVNGIKVRQVGASDDVAVGEVDLDLRGKVGHGALAGVIADSAAFMGIDSYPMHVADAIGVQTVAIFGSSYPTSTGPWDYPGRDYRSLPILLETKDRKGCERACYKDTCKVDAADPCINKVSPQDIFDNVMSAVKVVPAWDWKEYRPKIAGYTHILNAKTQGYPYVQSIKSMMDFCDEVVVVDGGSTDGSVEFLRTELERLFDAGSPVAVNDHCKLNIITRKWDPDEPGMDGMQKAFGRAMVSQDMEFLW